jgi:hypothetical protein
LRLGLPFAGRRSRPPAPQDSAVLRHPPWPLPARLTAAGLFALVDGAAVYGVLAGWDWEDGRVWAAFSLFLAAVGVVEALAAWRFARAAPWLLDAVVGGSGGPPAVKKRGGKQKGG